MVLVAAEKKDKHIGRIRLFRVSDASAMSLIPSVEKSVEPGSTVCTDGWISYDGLRSKGYRHNIVRESADVGENLLPLAHRAISLLKRWLLGAHQGAVRQSHIDYYLDEFTFRFNSRTSKSRCKLFYRIVQQAVTVAPIKDSEIKGEHYI